MTPYSNSQLPVLIIIIHIPKWPRVTKLLTYLKWQKWLDMNFLPEYTGELKYYAMNDAQDW